MKLKFTKMQGAGNDFIVLDATQAPIPLKVEDFRRLADRHFGIGADQILIISPSTVQKADFDYRIINADGSEVEQCGNGARCFMHYIQAKGLTCKRKVCVHTLSGIITLEQAENGMIKVNMGAPVFDLPQIPFAPQIPINPNQQTSWPSWTIPVPPNLLVQSQGLSSVEGMVLSMGNPHLVIRVNDIENTPVAALGPILEKHAYFPQRVNVGFMQVVSRSHILVRVYERGAGETLACGTGICAAAVSGIRMGWLDEQVQADARGGQLRIHWNGNSQGIHEPVWMYGPAKIVYEGEIEL